MSRMFLIFAVFLVCALKWACLINWFDNKRYFGFGFPHWLTDFIIIFFINSTKIKWKQNTRCDLGFVMSDNNFHMRSMRKLQMFKVSRWCKLVLASYSFHVSLHSCGCKYRSYIFICWKTNFKNICPQLLDDIIVAEMHLVSIRRDTAFALPFPQREIP